MSNSARHNFSIMLAFAVVFGCADVRADTDPFAQETGHWMSLDHYSDSDKRGLLAPPLTKTESASSNDVPASSPPPPVATAVVAAPTRPVDLPIMPGMNKGFNVQVTTTEDDHVAPSPVVDVNAPDIHLAEKNWQSASSSLHEVQPINRVAGDELQAPLDVRLSYLPDSKISPMPTADRETAEHAARAVIEKGALPKVASMDEKKKATPAVCAAIDAYKKQQLTAIQSDRATLKALEDAISSLGLQKQLGFMTSNASGLAGGQSSATTMDIPATTSLR